MIAHAFAEDDGAGIVVTEEYERATNKSKIKIPGLCKVFDIECINTAKLLRVLNADFSRGRDTARRSIPRRVERITRDRSPCVALLPGDASWRSSLYGRTNS